MAAGIRKLRPLLDRIIVEKLLPETTTKGGVILPEQGLGKVLRGTVISAGPGTRDNSGNVIPVSVKEGDQVLLPEYGGTKITLEEKGDHQKDENFEMWVRLNAFGIKHDAWRNVLDVIKHRLQIL